MNQPHSSPPCGGAAGELVGITKAYELVRELTGRVNRYPRVQKFVLGDRTLSTAYEVLDLLVEAKYVRNKVPLLDQANLRLDRLRFQIRLAYDDHLMSADAYGLLARQVDAVGRLVGGWKTVEPERQQRLSRRRELPRRSPAAHGRRESARKVQAGSRPGNGPNTQPGRRGW